MNTHRQNTKLGIGREKLLSLVDEWLENEVTSVVVTVEDAEGEYTIEVDEMSALMYAAVRGEDEMAGVEFPDLSYMDDEGEPS